MPLLVFLALLPFILIAAYVIFWFVMIIDAAKKNNILWVLIILVLHGIGPILYYFIEYSKPSAQVKKTVAPKKTTAKTTKKPAAKRKWKS